MQLAPVVLWEMFVSARCLYFTGRKEKHVVISLRFMCLSVDLFPCNSTKHIKQAASLLYILHRRLCFLMEVVEVH